MRSGDRTRLALAALVLGGVALLALNIFAETALRSFRLDFTQERLYTLAAGTRGVIKALEEPVTARLYFSHDLGARSPRHGLYHQRVRELLEQFRDLSRDRFRLEFYDPEPFSDAEDRAVAAGLQGVPLSTAGDKGYFGLAMAGSTDMETVLPFFNLEREEFIEYDLAKMIYSLAHPKKRVIGIMSGLAIDGGGNPMAPGERWIIMDQIREFFEVKPVATDASAVPEGIDILMVVHPKGLADKTLYAIDQYVLGGGRVMAFVDPNAETENLGSPMPMPIASGDGEEFNRLLKTWGVRMVPGRIAGDLDSARRVNAGTGGRTVVSDYVAWLSLRRGNVDTKDVAAADIDTLNLATSGILERVEGAGTEVRALLSTGPRAMAIEADKVRFSPDVVELFRSFKPEGKALTLAARITGTARTAFPDGPPPEKADDKEAGEAPPKDAAGRPGPHRASSASPIHVVVIADADMLFDRFWVSARDFFGQKVLVPTANNGDFVINLLDTLAGSDALVGVRGRGRTDRPFHMVERIRREAEMRFRAKEEELKSRLTQLQTRLDQLQRKGGTKAAEGGEVILGAEDKALVAEARANMVTIRKELRGVQHALRSDIEALESRLKFIDIAGIPLALAAGFLLSFVFRRNRRGGNA